MNDLEKKIENRKKTGENNTPQETAILLSETNMKTPSSIVAPAIESVDDGTKHPQSSLIKPFVPESKKEKPHFDYNSYIKDILKQRGALFDRQNKFYLDREQYAAQNARMQKWGDAFKSLIDLTGALSGGYVKQRGENPYLLQAFEEMQNIPRERFANEQAENDYLLRFALGERGREDTQNMYKEKMQQDNEQFEQKINFDIFKENERLKLEKEKADNQKAYNEGRLSQQEMRNNIALAELNFKKKLEALEENEKKEGKYRSITVRSKDGTPLNFKLNNDQISNIIHYATGKNMLNNTEVGELNFFNNNAATGEGEKNNTLRGDLAAKVLQKMAENLPQEQIAGFTQWINNFDTEKEPVYNQQTDNRQGLNKTPDLKLQEDARKIVSKETIKNYIEKNSAFSKIYNEHKGEIDADIDELIILGIEEGFSDAEIELFIYEYLKESTN